MEFEDVKQYVDEHVDLIVFGKDSMRESMERASKFLVVISILSEFRLSLERRKAQDITLREALYHKAINAAEGKNVTEKKIEAEANPEYTTGRESVENLDAQISWAKTNIDIFNNAHILYRNLAKGE